MSSYRYHSARESHKSRHDVPVIRCCRPRSVIQTAWSCPVRQWLILVRCRPVSWSTVESHINRLTGVQITCGILAKQHFNHEDQLLPVLLAVDDRRGILCPWRNVAHVPLNRALHTIHRNLDHIAEFDGPDPCL